jgi:2-keto-4-pentenoate hydratase/2-oxohepta-3-ene-1,7-dioic acid hydratase in catechol pathway
MKHARIVHNGAVLDAEVSGEWITTAGGRRLKTSEAAFAPPCVPTKIICVGYNYRDHATELKAEIPREPLMFLKPPSAIVAHQAPIPYPRHTQQLEYEGELAVVIGQRARNVPRASASAFIWGYTLFNDVTARDVQQVEKQWFRAKAFDGSAPLGPWIADGLDPGALTLTVRVNGRVCQTGTTQDMIFDVPALIEAASAIVTLERGDVIATGTPRGVGPLAVDDVVEVEIAEIGVLRNTVARGG